ncbi:MAG: hypothetical protein DSY87_01035 [Methylococcus sp.]|jgi:hypothetical protein|nr:MAG: hypothetical protein DSY87_01035 [Methylococcus sp.]
MFRKLVLGTSTVFALWTALDFIFHGVVLADYMKETAHLWRPENESKMILNSAVVLIASLAFTLIYALLINPKGLRFGLLFGTFFGLAMGMVSGYGSYAFMPVPYFMALIWFLNGLVQGVCAGVAVGMLIQDD